MFCVQQYHIPVGVWENASTPPRTCGPHHGPGRGQAAEGDPMTDAERVEQLAKELEGSMKFYIQDYHRVARFILTREAALRAEVERLMALVEHGEREPRGPSPWPEETP